MPSGPVAQGNRRPGFARKLARSSAKRDGQDASGDPKTLVRSQPRSACPYAAC